jgi:PAS domain S-box-containing protein
MEVQRRERRPTRVSERRGWSLRNYMALFIVALLAVAFGAALVVRGMAVADARQSAAADANFSARVAAAEIANELALLQRTTANLAANPQAAVILSAPKASCTLTFAGGMLFTAGRLEVVQPDGTVICSSGPLPSGAVYATADWLPVAVHSPVIAGHFNDPITHQVSAVVAAPIGSGMGAVVGIVGLSVLGPNLSATFGGARDLEFLVTASDTSSVLAQSLQPGRWIGAGLAGTSFATSAGPVERRGIDGTTRLYGESTVAGTSWTVFAGADETAALSAADQYSNHALAIILAGMGVMLVIEFVVYQRVAEPVRRLSLVMRGSLPGLAADAVAGPGAAEVIALAEDFDQLMASIKGELAERLTREHAATVSERNYRTLFEGHPQPMWLYDVDTLAFLNVNDAAIAEYGYSRDEFLAMTIKDIRPPEDIPKFLELYATKTAGFDRTGPWRHLLKDGSSVQVLITSHEVTFGEHNARFVLAENLTENQRLELELYQSQARAASSAELNRAKDEMVSMVSHEMRTPLASLVGFAELLSTRDVTPEQRKEYLGVMVQEGRRLTSLINDFLDLQRIEGGHMQLHFASADVGTLIVRAVGQVSRDVCIPIETRLPDDLPLVRVDSPAMGRVLANLISNARKYSPNGGSIVIGATLVGGMVEVYVQDHGLGIPADAIDRLFGKFYRIDSPDRQMIQGAGLGLAITKNIVEGHGGKIDVSSAGPGKGATFKFTVPVARQPAQNGDVLIVEDDAGFAHLLEAELNAKGLSSVWAADAETAEHLMARKVPRAMVLDLLLPGLQGDAFLRRMRANHGLATMVVVVTLKDLEPAEDLSLQKAGVTAVLRKGPGAAETAATLVAKSLVSELVPG